uniref:NADH dehydrogenase subunit 2 n=1 Tax=Setodes brevicaudatus TaxID=1876047 RepID=UPI0022DCDE4F|nr:NADH dehydrogenase subunit 2 [Setodes brevicaudatus]UZZ44377.1 NADH dehydrogenase subunit 2 [Setodes brevicaudatus]
MFIKLNNLKFLLMSMIFMTIMLSISSLSWLNMWISLEINTMSFIPLMINLNLKKTSKSMIIYFLIQAISSMNFLFFLIYFFFMNNHNFEKIFILTFTLLMKMGSAPMYFWFPKVMKNIDWMNNFMLMTWQKIIPMMLIKYFFEMNLFFMAILMNTFLSSILALNQTNLKLIMAYSSINHLGWLMMSLLMNLNTWIIYFTHYLLINYILCKLFFLFNMKYMINIFFLKMKIFMKIFILMNFLSLSGLPPFLGFLPKWIIILHLMNSKMYLIMFLMLMSALINIFFYIRLMTTSIIISNYQMKWYLFYLTPYYSTFFLMNLIYTVYFSILVLSFLLI